MAKIRVSGQIIKEVSQNIPSGQLALTELIKNSYEAGAKQVTVSVTNSKLTIVDNGSGMSDKEIDSLLNLSYSNKIFGSKLNGRYVSGEKGLGFFSAFKFGSVVEVYTKATEDSNNASYFKLDADTLSTQSDVSNFNVLVSSEEDETFAKTGTTIIVTRLDSEVMRYFRLALANDSRASKMTNIIDDPDFSITVLLDGKVTANDKNDTPRFAKCRIASLAFDSQLENTLELTVGTTSKKVKIPTKFEPLLKLSGFRIQFSLNYYNLQGVGVDAAPKLYLNQQDHKLAPLIYVNDSLFEDSSLYNIEINAKTKSSTVFRQQTGKIKIYLDKPDILKFNPDRTKIIESDNYFALVDFDDFVSSESQKMIRTILDGGDSLNQNSPKDDTANSEHTTSSKATGNGQNQNDSEAENTVATTTTVSENDSAMGQRVDPNAFILKNTFDVGNSYSFDDLIQFKDSTGGVSIKPGKLQIEPQLNVSINQKAQKFYFLSSGEFRVIVSFTDRKNGEEKQLDQTVQVRPVRSSTLGSEEWINSIVDSRRPIDPSIELFRIQINQLHQEGGYDKVLVSSLRTFVELIVRKISKNIGASENDKLNAVYNDIISDKNIDTYLIKPFASNQSVHDALQMLSNTVIQANRITPLINFLNLTTHQSNNILGIADVDQQIIFFRFLYTYLVIVTNLN